MFIAVFHPEDEKAVAAHLDNDVIPLCVRGEKRLGSKVHPSKREDILSSALHTNFFVLGVDDVFDSTQLPDCLKSAQYIIDYSVKKKAKAKPKAEPKVEKKKVGRPKKAKK